MKAKLMAFGELEIDGQRYAHDVVIDGGNIRQRVKKASKAYRETYGYTPLSVGENGLDHHSGHRSSARVGTAGCR